MCTPCAQASSDLRPHWIDQRRYDVDITEDVAITCNVYSLYWHKRACCEYFGGKANLYATYNVSVRKIQCISKMSKWARFAQTLYAYFFVPPTTFVQALRIIELRISSFQLMVCLVEARVEVISVYTYQ